MPDAEPKALCLIADLALDHEVFDASLWDALLRQMLQLRLQEELQRVLVAAAGIAELWCLPCLEQAWARVIQASVARASAGGAQSEAWSEQALRLVGLSPFSLRTDTSELVTLCQRQRKHANAIAAAMMGNQQVCQSVEK